MKKKTRYQLRHYTYARERGGLGVCESVCVVRVAGKGMEGRGGRGEENAKCNRLKVKHGSLAPHHLPI